MSAGGTKESNTMKLRQLFLGAVTVALACAVILRGQSFEMETFNPLSSTTSGLHLYGASVSGSYFSNPYGVFPTGLFGSGTSDLSTLQTSATVGWLRQSQTAIMSLTYSPMFVHTLSGPTYQSLNHSVAFSGKKTFGAKWTAAGSAQGVISDFSQLLFATTPYASASKVESTFDDLAAAVLTGRSDNAALAALFTSAPLATSPETAVLYGSRILAASAGASVSYASSSRSTYQASLQIIRAQYFSPGSNGSSSGPNNVVPATTSGLGSVAWSYSLTPRTVLSLSASTTRTISKYQDAYGTQAMVTIGHTLSRRWFVRAGLGAGFISPLRETIAVSQGIQAPWRAGIGFKGYAHTLLASYERPVADMYGLGANATDVISVAWTWQRPGRSISASGAFGYVRLVGPRFSNEGSWTAHASTQKAFGPHWGMMIGYTYLHSPNILIASASTASQSGVMATLYWLPVSRR
jgi:hypothetical protein